MPPPNASPQLPLPAATLSVTELRTSDRVPALPMPPAWAAPKHPECGLHALVLLVFARTTLSSSRKSPAFRMPGVVSACVDLRFTNCHLARDVEAPRCSVETVEPC
jgi:hypothetical protein